MKVKNKIKKWFYRKFYCGFMNYDYLDRFKETGDVNDIERFLRYSSDIQEDIEEIVNDGYYYSYSCNGEFYHAHSLKALCVSIVQTLIDNPDAEFHFDDDVLFTTYSNVDMLIIDKLITRIRELVKA